jgi:hypothetical protein
MLLGSRWKLCGDARCREFEWALMPRDRLSIHLWLLQFELDETRRTAIRDLVSQERGPWAISRMTDEMVMDEVSKLLVDGLLHVHFQPIMTPGRVTRSQGNAVAPFPLSERRSQRSSPQPPPEQPTFSDQMEPSAQAAALAAAAASGVPFCPE